MTEAWIRQSTGSRQRFGFRPTASRLRRRSRWTERRKSPPHSSRAPASGQRSVCGQRFTPAADHQTGARGWFRSARTLPGPSGQAASLFASPGSCAVSEPSCWPESPDFFWPVSMSGAGHEVTIAARTRGTWAPPIIDVYPCRLSGNREAFFSYLVSVNIAHSWFTKRTGNGEMRTAMLPAPTDEGT